MEQDTTVIEWADINAIKDAESGDIVGSVKWLGVDYNVIKVIRTYRGNVNTFTWTNYWLDRNLDVYDYIKSMVDWGEMSDIEIRDTLRDWFGILPSNFLIGGENVLGTTFHNAVIATDFYKFFMHPQFELPNLGAYGDSFNNGNNGLPDSETWTALDFKPLPGTPWDKNFFHYWVSPAYVSGRFYGLLGKDISIRTVNIKKATAPTWRNGFEYKLNYVYMKKWFGILQHGVDYSKTIFTDDGGEIDYEIFEEELTAWLISIGWTEDTQEFKRITGKIAGVTAVLAILIPIIYENHQTDWKGGVDVKKIFEYIKVGWPYMTYAFILFSVLFVAEGEMKRLTPNLYGLIRPKVRYEDYPDLDEPPHTIYNDPNFYGAGY